MILKKAIKKHGIINFRKEIIEHCDSQLKCDEREIFWISTVFKTSRAEEEFQ